MAVSMDQVINPFVAPDGGTHLPAECPLAMPLQRLDAWEYSRPLPAGRTPPSVVLARVFVFSATLALTGLGTYEIYQVISPADITWLQVLFAALFAITFAWISFSCVSSILGFFCRRWYRIPPLAPLDEMGRTALLMPVYNEDPVPVSMVLERMGHALAALKANDYFDIFILSDTRDAAVIRKETQLFDRLRVRLRGMMPVYYRRRSENHHKKAGNIADFVTRWGGAYEHMIVLDADSDMTGGILVTLAQAMAGDPKAGVIQTLPLLRNRWTLYARMQQFAGRVYGPIIAAGLAAWHGRDSNYWGHNAIIRTKAFAESAGLPELEGRRPFGGHILSHDFIEAALMRRAGWGVYMLPWLPGSYEEAPPNLLELAGRDRRWCQGNLQHAKIIGARGLHWVSRIHLLQGIMSYLASPFWLLLLLSGLALSTVAQYTEPNYFPDGFSLFPAWPVFDPERALRLLGLTFGVLFVPKLLGIFSAMAEPETRRGCGGAGGLLKSFAAETVLSALLSPIMMLIQSRFVVDVLLGRDSGWKSQNRTGSDAPLREVAKRHVWHMIAGIAAGAFALFVSFQTFLWLLPIVAGLVLSPVISWATGVRAYGVKAWAWNIFRIPEETDPASTGDMEDAGDENTHLKAAE
ncbi:glucans biosynthesis glucosyltransferase MdoH [soil metagenome]